MMDYKVMNYKPYRELAKRLMELSVGEANELEDKLIEASFAIDALCTLHKVASEKVESLVEIMYTGRKEKLNLREQILHDNGMRVK